jgi:GNAT superfamily N-acetyltransferase
MQTEWKKDGFTISTEPSRFQVEAIFRFLSQTYWAKKRSRELLERAIRHSFCFALFNRQGLQVGFARVITDYATYAYLADVYVLEEYRGQGLATWMLQTAMAHPELKDLRRWCLVTKDAHRLYHRLGFTDLQRPERHLEKALPHPDEAGPLSSGLRRIRRALGGAAEAD